MLHRVPCSLVTQISIAQRVFFHKEFVMIEIYCICAGFVLVSVMYYVSIMQLKNVVRRLHQEFNALRNVISIWQNKK